MLSSSQKEKKKLYCKAGEIKISGFFNRNFIFCVTVAHVNSDPSLRSNKQKILQWSSLDFVLTGKGLLLQRAAVVHG